MYQEEDCSGTQEQPTAEQKIYKSVSKDKSAGCRPKDSAISTQPSGGLGQISAETFTTMKIQDKDENKFSDEDGVVWDLTTWIIFYSLLPWFAGEILSSQVVEFIGGPHENWGKGISEGLIIWSTNIPVSEKALNHEFWNQVVLLPCKVVLDSTLKAALHKRFSRFFFITGRTPYPKVERIGIFVLHFVQLLPCHFH